MSANNFSTVELTTAKSSDPLHGSNHHHEMQQSYFVDTASVTPQEVIKKYLYNRTMTKETIGLRQALFKVQRTDAFLFGHQLTNYVGQYFTDIEGANHNSDIYNATGSYPSVFGFDWTSVLEDGRDFTKHVKFAYSVGAVVTFDWKTYNPDTTDGDANTIEGRPCEGILRGWSASKKYTFQLDEIVRNIKNFTDDESGCPIPIVFRLFHEMTGAWYWWGTGDSDDDVRTCSDEHYVELWQYTVAYMNKRGVGDQILWLYAPAKPSEYYDLAFHTRYPGNDLVDIVGFDRYSHVNDFSSDILEDCRATVNFSLANGMVAVIGETGIDDGIQNIASSNLSNWYYDNFTKVISGDEWNLCNKISYALTWENYSPNLYWVPLEGEPLIDGLTNSYSSRHTMFADDTRWVSMIYEKNYCQGTCLNASDNTH